MLHRAHVGSAKINFKHQGTVPDTRGPILVTLESRVNEKRLVFIFERGPLDQRALPWLISPPLPRNLFSLTEIETLCVS